MQKKFILQTSTTPDGVSVIGVVPIDQSDSIDDAPITVSAITSNSGASSPNSSTSQQLTAQVAVVQTQTDNDAGPQFITVNGEYIYLKIFNINTNHSAFLCLPILFI